MNSNLAAIKYHFLWSAKAISNFSLLEECFMVEKKLWENLWCGIVHDAFELGKKAMSSMARKLIANKWLTLKVGERVSELQFITSAADAL
jgi:hypothetical protein